MSDKETVGNRMNIQDALSATPLKWKAKDLSTFTAMHLRKLIDHECHDDLHNDYGLTLSEAVSILRYAELASMRLWGIDEMVEAVLPGQASSSEQLRRRISLAMKAEKIQDSIHPADALFLLLRSDFMLVGELRDAVAANIGKADFIEGNDLSLADWNRLLKLSGKPMLSKDAANQWGGDCVDLKTEPANPVGGAAIAAPQPSDTAIPAVGAIPASRKWDEFNLNRLSAESKMPGMTQQKLASQYGISRQMVNKLLKKVETPCSRTQRANPFDSVLQGKRKR